MSAALFRVPQRTSVPPDFGMVTQEIISRRCHALALGVIRFCRAIGGYEEGRIIRSQLMRCGTSVAANYRAVRRARSRREFVAKLGIVIEELDESLRKRLRDRLLPDRRIRIAS